MSYVALDVEFLMVSVSLIFFLRIPSISRILQRKISDLKLGLSLINALTFGHIKVWQSYDKPEVKISRVITNGLCKLKINSTSLVFQKL